MQRPSSLRSAPYTGPEWPHSTLVAGADAVSRPSAPGCSGSERAAARAARLHTRTDESAKQPAAGTTCQNLAHSHFVSQHLLCRFFRVHVHCELTELHKQTHKAACSARTVT